MALLNILRLRHITGNPDLLKIADRLTSAFSDTINQYPSGYTYFLCGLDFAVGTTKDIVIAGDPGRTTQNGYCGKYGVALSLKKTLIVSSSADKSIEDVTGRVKAQDMINNKATVYVCEKNTCKPPATDIREIVRLLESMTAAVGLPGCTPLNARVTAVMDHGDHRVEKIVFESQPGFHVTANSMYRKGGRAPYPTIPVPAGPRKRAPRRTPPGNASGDLCAQETFAWRWRWDTIGQGSMDTALGRGFQRSKVVPLDHKSIRSNGLQCLLVGDALARYTIWDGMRALDYLLSRGRRWMEARGHTGNSGGGTPTRPILGALDDRIRWPRRRAI